MRFMVEVCQQILSIPIFNFVDPISGLLGLCNVDGSHFMTLNMNISLACYCRGEMIDVALTGGGVKGYREGMGSRHRKLTIPVSEGAQEEKLTV